MKECIPSKLAKLILNKSFCPGLKQKDAQAEHTRLRILQAAFEEMYEHGYQGMRIENILNKTKLAKGALYHHFSGKQALGYAVADEVLYQQIEVVWQPLTQSSDPVTDLCLLLRSMGDCITAKDIEKGCPINNLAQEMAGLDKGFNQRLNVIYQHWINTISNALKSGQKYQTVRADISPETVSIFIVSTIQGAMGIAKCMQSQVTLQQLTHTLCEYLEQLRPIDAMTNANK